MTAVELHNLYLVTIGDCEFACASEKCISLPHITNYFRISLKDGYECISFKLFLQSESFHWNKGGTFSKNYTRLSINVVVSINAGQKAGLNFDHHYLNNRVPGLWSLNFDKQKRHQFLISQIHLRCLNKSLYIVHV